VSGLVEPGQKSCSRAPWNLALGCVQRRMSPLAVALGSSGVLSESRVVGDLGSAQDLPTKGRDIVRTRLPGAITRQEDSGGVGQAGGGRAAHRQGKALSEAQELGGPETHRAIGRVINRASQTHQTIVSRPHDSIAARVDQNIVLQVRGPGRVEPFAEAQDQPGRLAMDAEAFQANDGWEDRRGIG